jgi:hypothetical protein
MVLGPEEIVVTGAMVTVGIVVVVPGNVVTVGIVVSGVLVVGIALVCPDPPPLTPPTVVDGAATSGCTALPVGRVDVGASLSIADRAAALCEGSLSARVGVVVTGASLPIAAAATGVVVCWSPAVAGVAMSSPVTAAAATAEPPAFARLAMP